MKKILSLDGGGIKGVFAASFLACCEEQFGSPIARYFDLIAGTSTGGIIALGLGAGLTARDVLDFYVNDGPSVFGGGWLRRNLLKWRSPKYKPEPLKAALEPILGDKRLGDSCVRLFIPSANLELGEVHIYKTAHHERLTTDFREPMLDVALATAAAPSYFPVHRTGAGVPLVDGGVWANNPAGFAAVEAVSMLGWKQGEFRILSLGCTNAPLRLTRALARKGGRLYWARKAVDLFMKTQSSASLGIAMHVAGNENVLRFDPAVADGRFELDSVQHIDALKGLGATEARKAAPALLSFFQNEAEPFVPLWSVRREPNDSGRPITAAS